MGVLKRPSGRSSRERSTLAGLAVLTALAFALLHANGMDLSPPSFRNSVLEAARQLGQVTEADGLHIAEYCQTADALDLGEVFIRLRNGTVWTACPSAQWMDKFQELSPGGNKTFFDIGCNKGYTSAHFFGLWAPDLGFNPETLQKDKNIFCGHCNDCLDKAAPARTEVQSGLTVIGVEPNMPTLAHLILTRDVFFNGSQPALQWHIVHSAVSNASSFAPFPRCTANDEECALTFGNAASLARTGIDVVPLRTVDELIAMYNVQYVDILKIDTEGFDAPAMEGAMGALMAGRVGVITFEYHFLGVWPQYQLADVAVKLGGLNYVCYYSGQIGAEGSLARLTGCFTPVYEMHDWSNVVCVRRDHLLYPHMERMSTRYARYAGTYYQDDKPASARQG